MQKELTAEKFSVINKGYLTILGGLLWIAVMTCPDLMFHVSHLARLMKNPSMQAYDALINCLLYTYGRRHLKLTYGGNGNWIPQVWSDSSFGGATVDPYGGGFIQWQNGAIAWFSRKLKFIPLSTCEAEIAALVSALKEAMFVLEILFDLGHEFDSVDGYTDSKSGYDTVMNPGVTKRTAHFERWLFWARELYLEKKLLLNHIRDEDMMADSLSKVTDRAKFLKCRATLLNLNHG